MLQKSIFYEIYESNNPGWLNKGSWYNTDICSKLHGKMFKYFITNARTDRYYLMFSIVAHDLKKPRMNMNKAVLDIVQYIKTQQQKHYKKLMLP